MYIYQVRTVTGKSLMYDDQRLMYDGKRSMYDDRRVMYDGKRPMYDDRRLMYDGKERTDIHPDLNGYGSSQKRIKKGQAL